VAIYVTDHLALGELNLQLGIELVRNFTNSAERELGEHAVFRIHNDYVKL
jgi:hypothetical protein